MGYPDEIFSKLCHFWSDKFSSLKICPGNILWTTKLLYIKIYLYTYDYRFKYCILLDLEALWSKWRAQRGQRWKAWMTWVITLKLTLWVSNATSESRQKPSEAGFQSFLTVPANLSSEIYFLHKNRRWYTSCNITLQRKIEIKCKITQPTAGIGNLDAPNLIWFAKFTGAGRNCFGLLTGGGRKFFGHLIGGGRKCFKHPVWNVAEPPHPILFEHSLSVLSLQR